MAKKVLVTTLVLAAAVAVVSSLGAQEKAATQPAGAEAKTIAFDSNEALAGWTITGDVTIDTTKDRAGNGGALKIAPGGKAVLKLRDKDESGKVEIYVYDDGTKPEDPKANRAGPRWGLLAADGHVLAACILYTKYLSGDVSYAAQASDGKKWTTKYTYLGTKRAPAGWHKWTFDLDAEKGLRLLFDDKEIVDKGKPRFDWNATDFKGFQGIVLYGDAGKGNEQTIWVDDVSVTLGGPMKVTPAGPATKPASAPK